MIEVLCLPLWRKNYQKYQTQLQKDPHLDLQMDSHLPSFLLFPSRDTPSSQDPANNPVSLLEEDVPRDNYNNTKKHHDKHMKYVLHK